MRPALRYEIVRLRTLRSTWWLLIAAVAATALISLGISYAARTTDLGSDGLAWAMTGGGQFAPLPLAAVFAGLVGVFSLGHEYRYGTIRPALTAVPRRGPFLAAKVLVTSVWAIVIAVASAAGGWLVAVLTAGEHMSRFGLGDGSVARVLVGFVLLTLMWGIVGLTFSGLFRSLPAAIVLLLLIPLVIEPILAVILFLVPALDDIQWLTKYLPFGAGQQMTATDFPASFNSPDMFTPLPGGITFGVFTVALLIACATSFARRDA